MVRISGFHCCVIGSIAGGGTDPQATQHGKINNKKEVRWSLGDRSQLWDDPWEVTRGGTRQPLGIRSTLCLGYSSKTECALLFVNYTWIESQTLGLREASDSPTFPAGGCQSCLP